MSRGCKKVETVETAAVTATLDGYIGVVWLYTREVFTVVVEAEVGRGEGGGGVGLVERRWEIAGRQ